MMFIFNKRSKPGLALKRIPSTPETLEVGMNEYVTARIRPNETWRAHAGPLIVCTAMGAIATLSNLDNLVHLQHYRSPERDEGFATFTDTMRTWEQEADIVSMIVGVLSPRNKTAQPIPTERWARPISEETAQRLKESAQHAFTDVNFFHETYLVGRHGFNAGDRYPGMDVAALAMGKPHLSIYLK